MNKLKFLTLSMVILMAAVFAMPRLQTARAAAPANDDFYNAEVVTGLPFSETINVTDATTDASDPYICGQLRERTVWYSFTPSTNMILHINTSGSSYYPAVGVFTGSYGSLTEIGCMYYTFDLSVSLSTGATYYIAVASLGSGYPPPEGDYILQINLTQITGPANDNFVDAKIVDTMPYQDTVDTTNATGESGEPADCGYQGPIRTIWYAYTPSTNGRLSGNVSANFGTFLSVYTGSSVNNLSLAACTNYGSSFQVNVISGTTYYIQVGSLVEWEPAGELTLHLYFTPPPPNDDFVNAMIVGSIPYSESADDSAASIEAGEPSPSCMWDTPQRTIWYAYTPAESGSLMADKDGHYYSFIAIYTGTSIDQLTQVGCAAYGYNRLVLPVTAGVTYYFQLGGFVDWDSGYLNLSLSVPPPPTADFWYPTDLNRFDNGQFCDNSYDPASQGFNYFWWNFGDGTLQEGPEGCVNHQFAADGDYTVWHKVQTTDGRTAEVSKTVSVRTHDVAITKFTVPNSAKVGQTRSVTVGVRNSYYPENVTVELYKSTAYGYVWVGSPNQSVPVRPSNRTTDFNFSYTFTNDDGKLGKVTFKAVAILNNARDALPADNEAIALPTKVTGYKPYSATVVNPSTPARVASTFGLLALGLAFGVLAVRKRF